MTSKISDKKRAARTENIFKSSIMADIERLYNNDVILENKIQVLRKMQEEIQQTKKQATRELSLTADGVYIRAAHPYKILSKIITDKNMKSFFDTCRKNNIMGGASYIE